MCYFMTVSTIQFTFSLICTIIYQIYIWAEGKRAQSQTANNCRRRQSAFQQLNSFECVDKFIIVNVVWVSACACLIAFKWLYFHSNDGDDGFFLHTAIYLFGWTCVFVWPNWKINLASRLSISFERVAPEVSRAENAWCVHSHADVLHSYIGYLCGLRSFVVVQPLDLFTIRSMFYLHSDWIMLWSVFELSTTATDPKMQIQLSVLNKKWFKYYRLKNTNWTKK